MTRLGRLLAIAAALNVTAGAAIAAAQTVMVRNAPPGITVEALLNDTVVATGTTSPQGDVSLDLKMPEPGEMDANVFVDVCEKSRRVSVVDRNKRAAPPPAGCDRREISGIFWVRRVNTLVVDLVSAQPSMLLVKGLYAAEATVEGEEGTERRQAPNGLALFGGTGLGKFRDCSSPAATPPGDGHDGGFGYCSAASGSPAGSARRGLPKPRAVRRRGRLLLTQTFDVDLFTAAGRSDPRRSHASRLRVAHQSTSP
jgi:hypothetical protein